MVNPLEALEIVAATVLAVLGAQASLALWRLNIVLKEAATTARYVRVANNFLSFLDADPVQSASGWIAKLMGK